MAVEEGRRGEEDEVEKLLNLTDQNTLNFMVRVPILQIKNIMVVYQVIGVVKAEQ